MTSIQFTEINGIRVNQIQSSSDNRGAFLKFHPLGEIDNSLDSVAVSCNPLAGTVRGLHFQVNPFAEEKLVTCIQGSIFDVVVDLRPDSETFGRWASINLSAVNLLQIYLPKGIAHGFQTLVPNSIVHYCLTAPYAPNSSHVIDPFGDLEISWPMDTDVVSDRDKGGLTFSIAAQRYAATIGFE